MLFDVTKSHNSSSRCATCQITSTKEKLRQLLARKQFLKDKKETLGMQLAVKAICTVTSDQAKTNVGIVLTE